jgi:cell wall-associated NlpC family hydrolase
MISDITLSYALAFLGTPYIWGGQSQQGVDCSGFTILVLQAEGLLPNRFDANSQGLYDYFRINGAYEVRRPSKGCLVFYGKDRQSISHVAVCLTGGQIIEAAGGNSTTKTPEDAAKRGAHVRIRPIDYRKDIVAILDIDIKKVLPIRTVKKKKYKRRKQVGVLNKKVG